VLNSVAMLIDKNWEKIKDFFF